MTPPHSDLTRRALITGSAAVGAAAVIGLGSPAVAAQSTRLPSSAWLKREVSEMVGLGPRLPGSAAHQHFVDGLIQDFKKTGCEVQRDRHKFTRWTANRVGIEVLSGAERGTVPVASYYSYSGRTPRAGVTAQLAYLGALPLPSITGNLLDLETTLGALQHSVDTAVADLLAGATGIVGGIEGKVVLVDAPVLPLPLGTFYALKSYLHDPDHTVSPTDDYKRVWTTLLTLPTLAAFQALGVAGVIFALDASPANAKGQYIPFVQGLQDTPALIVDRTDGDRLRRAAASLPKVHFTLDADISMTTSDSFVAVLPGRKGVTENVIAHTHTDGPNFVEENCGIALKALAGRYGAMRRSDRDRSIVFSLVTGHFATSLPETAGFLADHADLVKHSVAALTVEHFGCTEWLDDSKGYHPTGQDELGVIFHSLTGIAAVGEASMKQADLRRSMLVKPIGPFFFGVGLQLHLAGIPSLAYIGGPNYLLALDGKRGHLPKFSPTRMRQELGWADNALGRLMKAPALPMKLGDSLLYSLKG